jgi:TetR/AcrR family transcriptional regulator
MATDRDLNRTRERIMAAALAEFSAKGLAGARTDAIARRAGVNERMIFYCFETKEGLYREVLRSKLAKKAHIIDSTDDDDFATALVKGYESSCSDLQHVRMWQWEALDSGRRKIAAEEERRALIEREIAQIRRAQLRGELPADIDEDLLLLVRIGLLIAPVAFPQFTRLVAGTEHDDPKFRRRWSKCLRAIADRIAAPRSSAGLRHPNALESQLDVQ